MAQKAVTDAVKVRLDDLWDKCPVFDNNTVGQTPDDGSPYLVVQYPIAITERRAVNSRYYQEEGAIRLVLHIQRGEGTARADEWTDELATIFRDRKFGGVETQVPSSPVTDDDNENGNYFLVSVAVPYTFNFRDDT